MQLYSDQIILTNLVKIQNHIGKKSIILTNQSIQFASDLQAARTSSPIKINIITGASSLMPSMGVSLAGQHRIQ